MFYTVFLFAYPLWFVPLALCACYFGPAWLASTIDYRMRAAIVATVTTILISPVVVGTEGFAWPGPSAFAFFQWDHTFFYWQASAVFFGFCFGIALLRAKKCQNPNSA